MRLTAVQDAVAGRLLPMRPTDFPSLGAPLIMSGLASLYGRSRLADRIRVANVAISNVPGSPVPVYLAGARMLDYYPVSIVGHGVALNITVQSYQGQLCFGLIACRRAVPDVREIAHHMQRAFDALKKLPLPEAEPAPAALPAPAKRRAPRKAKLAVVPPPKVAALPAKTRRARAA